MSKWWPYGIAVVAGIAAALSALPYSWAHLAATAVSAGLATIVSTSATIAITARASGNNQPKASVDQDKPKMP